MNKKSYLYAIAAAYTDSEKPLEVKVSHKGRWNGVEVYRIYPGKVIYWNHKWQEKGNLRDVYAKIVGKMPRKDAYMVAIGYTPEGFELIYDSRLTAESLEDFIARNSGNIYLRIFRKRKKDDCPKVIYQGGIEFALRFLELNREYPDFIAPY